LGAGIGAACALLPKGASQQACNAASHLFEATFRTNASMNQYIANQTSHCGCLSKQPLDVDERVDDSFEKFLINFCNSRQDLYKSIEECKEKSMALLRSENVSEKVSKKDIKKRKHL